jgi:metal-responsive CopG/Arc/MetJ family transcriptional regulator
MTVQIEIDEKLMSKIDEVLHKLSMDRTQYFQRLAEEDLVARQYREAYTKHPQTKEEIEEWEEVQYWEDE